jgi:5-formyltetrahydrofolate cyclo-ligase
MPKRSIRARFLAERKSLSQARRDKLSEQVQTKFLQSALFADAKFLALYSAIHNEVLTDVVARCALESGKRVFYPRVAGESLEFIEITALDDLVPGSFGVSEPAGVSRVPLTRLDLVVVPGVVFDRAGHRLGYGRGFYDRALHECRTDCMKIGFAYAFQVVDALPIVEEHDRALSVLMTEQETLNFTTC